MSDAVQIIITLLVAFIASGGFWSFVTKKSGDKTATTRLMMGIAYDRITTLGLDYIHRGWITKDELEDFRKYFYEPYKALGGNGVAERIMNEVTNLPFKQNTIVTDIVRAKLANKEN